jgi:hypothetical protein
MNGEKVSANSSNPYSKELWRISDDTCSRDSISEITPKTIEETD